MLNDTDKLNSRLNQVKIRSVVEVILEETFIMPVISELYSVMSNHEFFFH